MFSLCPSHLLWVYHVVKYVKFRILFLSTQPWTLLALLLSRRGIYFFFFSFVVGFHQCVFLSTQPWTLLALLLSRQGNAFFVFLFCSWFPNVIFFSIFLFRV